MNLNDFDLLKLMPKFMRDDETTVALCKAIEPQLQNIIDKKNEVMVLPYIDKAPEWLLDELAQEKNISWYDTTANVETKRKLVKSANYVKSHIGTVGAVERVVSDYFGDAKVEEWFSYNGNPFTFRVVVSNPEVTDELASLFITVLEKVKNVRSRLEKIIVDKRAEGSIYYAAIHHEVEKISLIAEGGF